jgi:hypothetical protein
VTDMKEIKKAHSQRIPWWIYISIATILYFGLTYFPPPCMLKPRGSISSLLLETPNLAPIGAIVFLLLGAKTLLIVRRKKVIPLTAKQAMNNLEDYAIIADFFTSSPFLSRQMAAYSLGN